MKIIYSYDFGSCWVEVKTYNVTTAKRMATKMMRDARVKCFSHHKMYMNIPYECRDVRIVDNNGNTLDKGNIVYNSFLNRLAWMN